MPTWVYWAKLWDWPFEGLGDGWIGLFGALIGAGVSGYISYLLQKAEHEQADARRLADRLEGKKSLALSLIIKLNTIVTGMTMIKRHLDEEFSRPAPLDVQPWQRVTPVMNDYEPVHITSDELALLLEYRLDEAFGLAASLSAVHSQNWAVMREYARRREQLHEMVPHSNFRGRVGTLDLSSKDLARTGPIRIEMNDLVSQLYKQIDRDVRESVEAMRQAHGGLVGPLKLNIGLTFPDDF